MNDDDEAFARMFREHYQAVLRYAWRRAGPAEAADVAAETFRIAWERRDRLPSDDPLPWLYATARNVVSNLVRKDRRRDGLRDVLADELARHGGQDDHAAAVAARQAAIEALNALGERDRELVLLVCWEGLDLRQAAEAAGCSHAAAAMRLHRARKRLRHALADDLHAASTAFQEGLA
ncbi:RNA polymerase sigma factor [Actinomadura hibisca]|uniref:RNA polymerase sigma factor n=1 Tax=Actinomadura hibisca TaxID=68565 RepID=UPI000831FB18|nr:sigma-70 family RNA polymerase sigma factor [Actinomadura hibisca]